MRRDPRVYGDRSGTQDGVTSWRGVSTCLADFCLSPQALGLAGLVGEAEESGGSEEEREEEEGPLCAEKRFLRLSDGALLLRVLGIM